MLDEFAIKQQPKKFLTSLLLINEFRSCTNQFFLKSKFHSRKLSRKNSLLIRQLQVQDIFLKPLGQIISINHAKDEIYDKDEIDWNFALKQQPIKSRNVCCCSQTTCQDIPYRKAFRNPMTKHF